MIQSIINGIFFIIMWIFSYYFYQHYFNKNFERQSLFFSVICVLYKAFLFTDVVLTLFYNKTIFDLYLSNYVMLFISWSILYGFFLDVCYKVDERISFFAELIFCSLLVVFLTFYFFISLSVKVTYETTMITIMKLYRPFLFHIFILLLGVFITVFYKVRVLRVTFVYLIMNTFMSLLFLFLEILMLYYDVKDSLPIKYVCFYMNIIFSMYFLHKMILIIKKNKKLLKSDCFEYEEC